MFRAINNELYLLFNKYASKYVNSSFCETNKYCRRRTFGAYIENSFIKQNTSTRNSRLQSVVWAAGEGWCCPRGAATLGIENSYPAVPRCTFYFACKKKIRMIVFYPGALATFDLHIASRIISLGWHARRYKKKGKLPHALPRMDKSWPRDFPFSFQKPGAWSLKVPAREREREWAPDDTKFRGAYRLASGSRAPRTLFCSPRIPTAV